jgi:superfamily II DNA or RNA helicase
VSDLTERARFRRVMLHGHFAHAVTIEAVEPIGRGHVYLRVRTQDGAPGETYLTMEALEVALAEEATAPATVDARDVFRWVESQRIALAYAYDPYFAVSLSGVRGLPHQIEAVYRHLLPQPRLRFVLADDPGAGKTIMAGLLLKELKLRGVVDRALVVCPAPLTIQWQDELLDRFDERFRIVTSQEVKWQLGGNPWQQHNQVITSLDFAKQDEVLPGLLLADWDLVVVDEAHKCSAVTQGEAVRRTRRYVLAEELSKRTERLLLLTATPHSGDEDRFTHFLALLDSDQFSNPDLVRRQIGEPDSPYFLRRQKEDLVDERGHALFVARHVLTQPFTLSRHELDLYEQVTTYVNRYLAAPAGGSRGSAVALARTVLQRRLASSLGAIRSSLGKRADRLRERAEEFERLSPAERARRLRELGRIEGADDETGVEDADEETEDRAASEVSAAEHVGALREEVAELRRLAGVADRAIAADEERKLGALRSCLDRAELAELRDGRGKLLIFTEHRDTLGYLEGHLREWGYSVCSIHGGHPPAERKRIQYEFHTTHQICVATEAAGEGINLQFCHLMINYDLPWNPVRLEQRMGRIHRIGQQSEVVVFNFCATNTVEGRLLSRLHAKLDDMRAALQGRVYDVIGDLLATNGVDLERMIKDTLANPRRMEASLDQLSMLTADRLAEYERDIGIAQATRNVNLDWVRQRDWLSEERRLMPEYVESFFLDIADRQRMRVDRRADGLLRIEHVPLALRSDELKAVRRLGRPATEYRKLTFRKEQRDRPEHEDAVLCSPGHPLFGATAEAMERDLRTAGVPGATACFIDPSTSEPYQLHFFAFEVLGDTLQGGNEAAHAALVAVTEEHDGQLELAAPDVLHDLTPAPGRPAQPVSPQTLQAVTNWVRVNVQLSSVDEQRAQRLRQAELRARYLEEAMDVQQHHWESRWAEADEKVYRGDTSYRLARDEAQRRVEELKRRRADKLEAFRRLGVVRPGPVAHLGTAWVVPPDAPDDPELSPWRSDPEVERAAMAYVMAHERQHGRNPEDVSARRDGSGFDIRSVGRNAATGELEVRRIEVKGRSSTAGDVGLYRTEWRAAERFGPGFWLYVVYSATTDTPRMVTVQDPFARLRNVREIVQVTGYRVPSSSIEEVAR